LLERQIVDARARQIDAAAQRRGVDIDVRRSGNDRGAGLRRRLRGGRVGCDRGIARRHGGMRRRRMRLFRLLRRRLILHLRPGEKIFPADHDDQRQHDGEDGVLVLVHSTLVHWRIAARPGARFWSRGGLRTCFM
jgi:hypothetical protein